MQKREKITLIIWLFLSLFICVESLRLGVGTLKAPGPRFLTFGVSVYIILSLCLLFLKKAGRKFAGNVAPLFKGKKILDLIYAFIALFGYPFLIRQTRFLSKYLIFYQFFLTMIKPQVYAVGDRVEALKIIEAIHEGARVGLEV